jgi:hypothetical protein
MISGKDRNIFTRNTGTFTLVVKNNVTKHNRYTDWRCDHMRPAAKGGSEAFVDQVGGMHVAQGPRNFTLPLLYLYLFSILEGDLHTWLESRPFWYYLG